MISLLEMFDTFIGQPCDEDGDPLDPASAPTAKPQDSTDWTPFRNRVEFKTAEFLYKRCQMSGSNIDILMELWAAYSALRDPEDVSSLDLSPFSQHGDMYSTIDAIPIGGVPWQSISLSYDGPIHENPLSWMKAEHTVWFRDPRLLFKKMLENPDFQDSFDYAPFRQYDTQDQRRYENFMSGDWAWKQAVSTRSCFTLSCINVSSRISLQRILRRMEHYLCPSSLAATKQQFPLQLGTMNIGPSTLQLATSTITSDVRMETGLSLLVFYLYPKVVSPFFYSCCYCPRPLTFYHQLTRLKLGLLSSDSFGESYSMSPCRLYWKHFALVKRSLRSFDVLMDIIDM